MLHTLFEANPTLPHRHVARLFLREAGPGSEPSSAQGETIREITRFAHAELDKKPFAARGSKRKRPTAQEQDVDAAEVRKGLRRGVFAPVPREQRPCSLRGDVDQHLREGISLAKAQGVGKLPRFPLFAVNHRRMAHERQDTGGNERDQAMQEWYQSEQGLAWRKERQELL